MGGASRNTEAFGSAVHIHCFYCGDIFMDAYVGYNFSKVIVNKAFEKNSVAFKVHRRIRITK